MLFQEKLRKMVKWSKEEIEQDAKNLSEFLMFGYNRKIKLKKLIKKIKDEIPTDKD